MQHNPSDNNSPQLSKLNKVQAALKVKEAQPILDYFEGVLLAGTQTDFAPEWLKGSDATLHLAFLEGQRTLARQVLIWSGRIKGAQNE